ncbi:arylsulfatase B-like isoform X2 [Mya arenaria]|uniref:arylsulfatase B-like isoform X2 n=1 Tax=Mya arenaria TaxID=6604 RepID=UPI0022DF0F9F|nr:arylsulfatase B-like isoform X2 [Mya arenaria]
MESIRPLLFIAVLAHLVLLGAAKHPHIIFIVADDLGWNDVGWHNDQMFTPNLDKMASRGVILNSSYVQPVCTPSRNCFMTGYYPFHTGLQHNVILVNTPGYLPSNFTTLPQKLKEIGYTTHMVGKWHLGFCNWKYTPTYRGFDSFMGYYNGAEDYFTHVRENGYDFRFNKSVHHPQEGEYSANVIAARAVEILDSVDPVRDQLYLYLPFQSVHAPLEVPERYENIYANISTKNRRTYCGMVSALDEAVGNITTALRDRGFMDNALIVFTTDNGGPTYEAANNLPLRGAKTTLWEGGTRGASFVYSENLLQKTGYTNSEMIHAVDWFPTLLTLAGGKPDAGMDGVNQWPTVSSGAPSARSEFVYNIDDISKNAAIRVGQYKLIEGSPGHFNGWTPLPPLAASDMVNASFPKHQLFDLQADPTEHHNIASDHPHVVSKLLDRLSFHKATMVPANNPRADPASNPQNFGGNWSPGWC